MARYDLAIVGGGPGGASAAKRASELGLKTIFFERARKPGEKNSSGCGLGQRWWRDFPEIMEKVVKLPSYREIHFCYFKIVDENDELVTTISTAKTKMDESRIVYKGENKGMSGASVYRCHLDPLLAELACEQGAEFRTSTLITGLIKKGERICGVLTEKGEKIEADIVIGADGSHSLVAIASGIRKRWSKNKITLTVQLDFSCNEKKLDEMIGPAELVWFGPFCGSYQVNFWDGFHLGVGQWLDKWDTRPQDMLKKVLKIPAFQTMCRALDAKMREYQAHLLPWMPCPEKNYAEGVLLVGDAGGFPCPLEAEGIWHAIWSGKIAAEVSAQAISQGDVSEKALSEFERRWKQPPLGLEYEYGEDFVNLWRNTVFEPEFMKKLVVFLGEFQWLNFPSPVFDWSDAHMKTFNQHLGHFLDLLGELAEFFKEIVAPLGKGISQENREKILDLLVNLLGSKLPRFIPKKFIRAMLRKNLGLKN